MDCKVVFTSTVLFLSSLVSTVAADGFDCTYRTDSGYMRTLWCPARFDECCSGKGCCYYADIYGFNLVGLIAGLAVTFLILLICGIVMCCFFCQGCYWNNRRATRHPGRVITTRPGALYYQQPIKNQQDYGGQPQPGYGQEQGYK